MSIFGLRLGGLTGKPLPTHAAGFVPYGRSKMDGSHDHRFNQGNDRTPAQRRGDAQRTKHSK